MSTRTALRVAPRSRSQPKRLRVLQIGKYYPPYMGGIETHLQTLCNGLRDSVDLTVLVANDRATTIRDVVEDVAVERLSTPFQVAGAPVCPEMVQRIRDSDSEIVHLHLPNPGAVLAYFASGHRGKVVVSYHSEVVRQRVLGWAFAPFLHRLLRRASAVIAATPHHIDTSAVLRRYRSRCHVIPYGIPVERFQGISACEVERIRTRYGPRLVVSVGRLVYYKGFEYLIESMKQVDGTLLLIGDGPLRSVLQRKAARAGVSDRVVFLGKVPDVASYYSAADVFVLPSVARSEAFGIVQLEAMACGTPVINTQLPSGVPYVSRHGSTGFTVAPADPVGLGKAINRVLSDPELRQSFGEQARRRVDEEFSQDAMVRSTLRLYERIMSSDQPDNHWT